MNKLFGSLLVCGILVSCTPAQVAVVGFAVNAFSTIAATKQMYCDYLPGVQEIALSRIRKVDPDWTPVCAQPIETVPVSTPVPSGEIPNDDIFLVTPNE